MQHDLDVWRDALNAFDHCDYEIAIDHFARLGNLSKAFYNTGVSRVALGQPDCAVASFQRAVLADPLMAVSHMQLGHHAFLQGRFKDALQHYEDTIKCMRGNAVLEYGQTGLDFTLYECEVWFNHGLCHNQLGQHPLALQSFMNAHQSKRLVRHDVIEEAIRSNGKDFMPFAPDDLKVYRPKRLPSLHGSSLLNSMTGLHTPVPSVLSDTLCGSRRVVAVAEGELAPNLVDFGLARRVSLVPSLPLSQACYVKFSYTSPEGCRITKYTRLADSVDELVKRLNEKIGLAGVRFKYQDSSGDWLYLFDDDDLAIALESSRDGIVVIRS